MCNELDQFRDIVDVNGWNRAASEILGWNNENNLWLKVFDENILVNVRK